MMLKKWIIVVLMGICMFTSMVTMAQQKSVRKQKSGRIVCECCGDPKCDCCNQPSSTVQARVAECGFRKPIRVATVSNNRPFGWAEWISNSGTGSDLLISKGYGVDVFEELAEKLQLKYQILGYTTDEEAINDLKKGNLDLLIGVYAPETTIGKGALPVYPALFSNVFTVFYHKDRPFEVTNLESLENKKGVIRRVENLYSLFSRRITPNMDISLDTTEGAFRKLLTGEVDYLIGSPYSVEAELRRYKLHNEIISSNKEIYSATLFMALTRATDCYKLRNKLSQALTEYTANPKKVEADIRKVIDDWGERFRENPALTVTTSNTAKN